MRERVGVDGKHLVLAGRPFKVRGVTYGSFLPRLDGELFPERARVKKDFHKIAEAGLNTLRVYSLPPVDVLDLAAEYGLRMIVGLHYDDWRMEPSPGRATRRRIREAGRRAVGDAVARCAARPEVLAIAVGNEVPVDVVRVHGIGAVQHELSTLVAEVHAADPQMPATYVNFPTTEFLGVDGQDLVCFNVFLEDPCALRRYLRHLQVISGSLPLVVTELGLPAAVHGEAAQAESLRTQLAEVDDAGCAGATVFSWTDEWGVGGQPVDGWEFGITDAEREAKPALGVVSRWARSKLVERRARWPKISVVVCAYNEERTIGECLASLARCEYPDLEVLVCDDGSTDRTLEIARQFPFRILNLSHGGLSRARNAGLGAATGEIVAYLDADAACHEEWPFHLALSLEDEGVVATGGPNLPSPDAGFVERAVALSPGGPTEVLTADDRAEHVPGCNMAYRTSALDGIAGFDAMYTSAGDDVDVCWKLLERGQEIAFAPAAQVHHHRRNTVRGYLRQQRGYGRAERMLIGAHPHRFNRLGQARWRGFMYGGPAILPTLLRSVVYHGHMGGAPFQPIARRRGELASMWVTALLPLAAPIALLGLVLGLLSPWWLLLPAAALAVVLGFGVAVAAAVRPDRAEPERLRMRALVGALHVAQPFVRAWGRIRGSPLERESGHPAWSGDRWAWLQHLESDLRARRCGLRVGGPSDSWDLQVVVGPFVAARITTAVMWRWEPHYTVRYRPRPFLAVAVAGSLAAALLAPWGWIVLAGIVVAVVPEAATLHARVRGGLRRTTRGATNAAGE
jgi:glycosyltransferase involved in cell wall biosynthesis